MLKQFIGFSHMIGERGLGLLAQDIRLQRMPKVMDGLARNSEFPGQGETRFAFENPADQEHHFGRM
jgi:hypothetical protein